jgi:hypothetical protein
VTNFIKKKGMENMAGVKEIKLPSVGALPGGLCTGSEPAIVGLGEE